MNCRLSCLKRIVILSILLLALVIAVTGCGKSTYQKGYDEGYNKGLANGQEDQKAAEENKLDIDLLESDPRSYPPSWEEWSKWRVLGGDVDEYESYRAGWYAGYKAGYEKGFPDSDRLLGIEEDSEDTISQGYSDGYITGEMDALYDSREGFDFNGNPSDSTVERNCSGKSLNYREDWISGYKDGYDDHWSNLVDGSEYQAGYESGLKNGRESGRLDRESGCEYKDTWSQKTTGGSEEWERGYKDGYKKGYYEGYNRL